MKKKLTWYDKYCIVMQEELTIKDIMNLRSVGQPKALEIRQDAIEYCLMNNIPVTSRKISTYAIMEVTGYNLQYYYQKMIDEAKALEIYCKSRGELHVSA